MKYLLLALLAVAAAPAVDAQPESAYYGLSLGEFDYEEGDGAIADSVSSYRLMVGYQFMEHLTVEGGYGETGTIRGTVQIQDPFFGDIYNIHLTREFKILTIRLLGVLPFDNGISLLVGLGYADLREDFTIRVDGVGEQSGDVDGNEPAYYVGAQYDWDRVALRLGYEKYDFGGGVYVSETSLTFFYKL
jgi:hypothetical protein